jgi:hypothetical protein
MSDIATCSTPLMNMLLPVVVGGLIAIIAGLVGPYFIQRAKDATEKKRKRAEKFEELVGAVYEYDHWIDTTRNIRIVSDDREITVSPIAKIRAISVTYFPEFERAVEELQTAGLRYGMWMLQAGQKRLQNEPEALAGHEEFAKVYVEKRQSLLTELRSFARREFQ